MPIKIPTGLPARKILEAEGVPVIREADAIHQDIRPLKIALLNLMPEKAKTETQLARVLGATPLQVELTLLSLETHKPKTTSAQHLTDFYKPWTSVKDEKFDGLIITGAPIEKLPFHDVTYWDELVRIFNWSTGNVFSLFNLCWGAQAALYHFHKVEKYLLPEKMFGIYTHRVLNSSSVLMRGLNDEIPVPVSRYTENKTSELEAIPDLEILLTSDQAGVALVHDEKRRHVHMFNHMEYDKNTLHDEYSRDRDKGVNTQIPANYYPGDDPTETPVNIWRSNAHLLFGNWINMIYQDTPFDVDKIGSSETF